MSILEVLRMVLGGLFVLFVPGFAWSYVFFRRGKIDWIERLTLSFGLSIALVPLCVFWINWLFQMKITLLNTSLTLGGLTAISILYILITRSAWGKNAVGRLKSAFKSNKSSQ